MPREKYYLPARKLVSQENASLIDNARVPRSRFIGAWTRKTAFDAGFIYPFMVDEILPGDHMQYDVTAYVRMATPLFPLFDNQRVDTFFFFVPARILWQNWVRMMGEQQNPTDSIAYTVPIVTYNEATMPVGGIADHMGLPIDLQGAGNAISVNALPFRAYNKIWNAWFRDQNILGYVIERTVDTGDLPADFALRRRAKAHDYFTTALPWPQKFTSPNMPLQGLAPIQGLGIGSAAVGGSVTNWYETARTSPLYPQATTVGAVIAPAGQNFAIEQDGTGNPKIYADLAQATGVAINALRQAFMVQQLIERDARGGTRYNELIRSHFGVVNPDARVQRPEYIGGGQSPLNLTPIAQTAPTAGAPLGALGAAGTATGQHRASYAATEHGYILGLINVRTELSYQQGLHKMWSRRSRYDFYWPALASLGEQAVLTQEIYCKGVAVDDESVFGYQERWQEYRTRYSEITGLMRSGVASTLDAWHLGQFFTAKPVLGQTFIEDTPPMDRVLAAGALAVNQQYLADILIQRIATRAIPTFGTPATLGRF